MKTVNTRDAARITESIQDVYFDQCVDFLVRMIEKYGNAIPQMDKKEIA